MQPAGWVEVILISECRKSAPHLFVHSGQLVSYHPVVYQNHLPTIDVSGTPGTICWSAQE